LPSANTSRRRVVGRGFTLVELAIVLAIVGLLLVSLMYTLSAASEQRAREETMRRLQEARELLIAFAQVNGRLPCPATAASNGSESGGGAAACTANFNGFLPATTIGFRPLDNFGFAIDAWGNRIRYSVSNAVLSQVGPPAVCRPNGLAPVALHFTNKANLQANGVDCAPNDLQVCNAASAAVTCAAGTAVTNQSTVVAIVLSVGKNGALPTTDVNELENIDGDPVFVDTTPSTTYDDMIVWIPVGLLYGRMIAAGVLP
jgi:prepilin-type N-terminal cleavage/methylation domain-containing protein